MDLINTERQLVLDENLPKHNSEKPVKEPFWRKKKDDDFELLVTMTSET